MQTQPLRHLDNLVLEFTQCYGAMSRQPLKFLAQSITPTSPSGLARLAPAQTAGLAQCGTGHRRPSDCQRFDCVHPVCPQKTFVERYQHLRREGHNIGQLAPPASDVEIARERVGMQLTELIGKQKGAQTVLHPDDASLRSDRS